MNEPNLDPSTNEHEPDDAHRPQSGTGGVGRAQPSGADGAGAGGPPRNEVASAPGQQTNRTTAGGITDEQVKMALRKVKDPELNLNIVDLGLVYGVTAEEGVVDIAMTLTSPGCPSGPEIMGDVERVVRSLPGVEDVNVNLVWSPFWTPERIEPRVRAYLGL